MNCVLNICKASQLTKIIFCLQSICSEFYDFFNRCKNSLLTNFLAIHCDLTAISPIFLPAVSGPRRLRPRHGALRLPVARLRADAAPAAARLKEQLLPGAAGRGVAAAAPARSVRQMQSAPAEGRRPGRHAGGPAAAVAHHAAEDEDQGAGRAHALGDV